MLRLPRHPIPMRHDARVRFARAIGRTAVVVMASVLSGCAGQNELEQPEPPDRFEQANRKIYRFNDAVDRAVTRPVAKGYRRIVPTPVKRHVRNFLANLRAPVDVINNLLQGKIRHGFADLGGFLFNSTIGLAGIFDPAGRIGMQRHHEDFGQTLAVWGVAPGPYLVLPFFGPSTLGGTASLGFDAWIDPTASLSDSSIRDKLLGLAIVNTRVQLLAGESAIEDSLDPYVFVREAYLQRRRYEIYDGNPPEDELYEEEVVDADLRAE